MRRQFDRRLALAFRSGNLCGLIAIMLFRSCALDLTPKALVQSPRVVVEDRLLELRIVEDALEDLFVYVHPLHDRVHEGAVEHKPEVLEVVVLSAGGELLVSGQE